MGFNVGFVARHFTGLVTSLQEIRPLGWLVLITGGVLWLKIQDTRAVLEGHIKEPQKSLTQLEENLTANSPLAP